MLGLKNAWKWFACGKHQVAKDYFQVGADIPILRAFSEWLDKGYQLLGVQEKKSTRLINWRFWSQGVKKDLICGFVRDSNDNIGRPYPFLIMGIGNISGWKNHWDLLPFAFEKMWNHMEYISNKRFLDFKQLEEEIRFLKTPEPLWSEYENDRKERYNSLLESLGTANGFNLNEMRKELILLVRRGEMTVPLDKQGLEDFLTISGLWHRLVKDSLKENPNAVFWGGGAYQNIRMTIYKRALSPQDFVRLWSDTPVDM